MRTKLLLVILAPLILCTLYSCFLDRSYREWWEEELNRDNDRWEAAATPGTICPNEEVTVTWNVGALRCGDRAGPNCVDFTTTNQSTGNQIFSNNLASGHKILRDINSDTNFIYSVTADNLDVRPLTWDTKFDRVKVTTVTTSLPNGYSFTARCERSRVDINRFVYNLDKYSLDMNSPEFIESTKGFGECVHIVKIQRITEPEPDVDGRTITVYSIDSGRSLPPTSLELGRSIEPLDLPTDLAYEVVVENSSPFFREGADCGGLREESYPSASVGPPPTFPLIFYLSCDTRIEGCT
jgi:hypothetical protein